MNKDDEYFIDKKRYSDSNTSRRQEKSLMIHINCFRDKGSHIREKTVR